MLSFKQLTEKKTKVLINPKKSDLQEKEVNHGEDCDCKKCEAKRRGEEVNDGPDIATEQKENKNCGCGKDPCETYGMKEGKEIPANVKKIAKELDKAVAMHKSQAQRLRKAGISEGKKKCGEGEYYCNDMKKCRPIPKGYRVGYGGMLKPENEKDESNGKKGGSNGNGNGHGGNGNGHGGNGNGGNGGGGNSGGE